MTISIGIFSFGRLSAEKDSSTNLPTNIDSDLKPIDLNDHQHGHSHGNGHSDSGSDCHEHEHHHEEENVKSRRAEKVLWVVAVLSAVFIAIEFFGGYLAQSLAIMSDAGHMLSDFFSFIISIASIRFARRPASKRLSFGYGRAEVLGALTSIVILWVLTVVLVGFAIERIVNNELDVESDTMLITATAGVFFNIVMALVLQFGSGGHGHAHFGASHGHSHDGKNVNVRAALIHVIGDLVQSIGVLFAAIIIKYTGWTLADPICTFVFSIIVLFTTIRVVKDLFFVLMEATPKNLDVNQVEEALRALKGVRGVHDLHFWSIGMDKPALSVHLAVETPENALETVTTARLLIRRQFGITVAAVQVEMFDARIQSCEQRRHNKTV